MGDAPVDWQCTCACVRGCAYVEKEEELPPEVPICGKVCLSLNKI